MNYLELENLRKKYLNKFLLIGLALITFIIVAILNYIDFIFGNIIGLLFFTIILYALSFYEITVIKNFESIVKQHYMYKIIELIIGKENKIFWKTSKTYNDNNDCINCEEECSYDPNVIIFDIFEEKIDYDDVFWGQYKGVDFSVVEINRLNSGRKYKGNIITLFLNKSFENKILFKKESFLNFGYSFICKTKNIKTLNINGDKYSISSKYPCDISSVLTKDFLDLVKNIGKDYLYLISNNRLYIMKIKIKDSFKLGSIFKPVNDISQRNKFEKEIREILNIVKKASTLKY